MGKISPTKKLYLEDAYTDSFQATLLFCSELPDGRFAAVLDETRFYPESGGQLADRGTIEDVEVFDVWEDGDEVIHHGLKERLSPGPVSCRADWDLRFDHMQQHTGQHILSRAFVETGNLQTISFHMGDDTCTIDIVGPELTEDVLRSGEKLANDVVWQDREVLMRTVTPSELKETSLRKKLPDGIEKVRLVEIDGFDVIGCCGTHVRRTGELGLIKVLKHEKSKGAYRVSFKVGWRAFRDFGEKHEIVKRLAKRFTTAIDGLDEKIDKLQAEGQRDRKKLQRISKRLATYEVEELLGTARTHNGRRYVVCMLADYDEGYLRMLASELKSKENTISMIGSDNGVVICNASVDIEIDFSRPVIERARSLGGSGGGKGGFATVRLPKEVPVTGFLEQAFEEIKSS